MLNIERVLQDLEDIEADERYYLLDISSLNDDNFIDNDEFFSLTFFMKVQYLVNLNIIKYLIMNFSQIDDDLKKILKKVNKMIKNVSLQKDYKKKLSDIDSINEVLNSEENIKVNFNQKEALLNEINRIIVDIDNCIEDAYENNKTYEKVADQEHSFERLRVKSYIS